MPTVAAGRVAGVIAIPDGQMPMLIVALALHPAVPVAVMVAEVVTAVVGVPVIAPTRSNVPIQPAQGVIRPAWLAIGFGSAAGFGPLMADALAMYRCCATRW